MTLQWKIPRAKYPVSPARGLATEPGESVIFKSKFLADPKTISVRQRVFHVPKMSSNEFGCRSSAAPLGEAKHTCLVWRTNDSIFAAVEVKCVHINGQQISL